MEALKRALFEDPLTIYVGLGMIEIVLLAVWRRYMTPRRLLALAGPLLLAGGVFLVERMVVTDAELIVAALEEIAESTSADPPDLGPIGTYLDRDVKVDITIMPWVTGTLDRDKALKTWPSLLSTFNVVSTVIRNVEVEVNGDSARARFATDVTWRNTKKGAELGSQLNWTINWIRRDGGWRIIGVDPPTQGLGL